MSTVFKTSLVVLALTSGAAHARTVEDCVAAWGQAARSYTSKQAVPTPDDAAFKPACELEAKGEKPAARAEAIKVAVMALAKLEGDSCVRFLTSYVAAKDPQLVCDAAGDEEALKKAIAAHVPPPGQGKAGKKK